MSAIRHKLEPDPGRPRYFVTVAGLGVKFEPDKAR
jgi:DNA-binding response OmpR family regulator